MKSQTFFLIIAPPAFGKTQSLKNVFKFKGTWIYVSPLRVLTNEFMQDLKLAGYPAYLWNREELPLKKDIIIGVTPEQISEKFLLKFETYNVVWDEVHLLFHWGDHFREKMWQAFFGLSLGAKKFYALTATMQYESELREICRSQFNEFLTFDYGNHQLKYPPQAINFAHRFEFENLIYSKLHKKPIDHVILVFCQYRQEVAELSQVISSWGFSVVNCVGGEGQIFAEKLAQAGSLDCIVATTVLGHGVNLPRIQHVFVTYPVQCLDFWIQMVARGGRRGEAFEVTVCDNLFSPGWQKCYMYIKYALRKVWQKLLGY